METYALRALTRRAHSVSELRRKLQQRAQNRADVTPLLNRLAARGWLDDQRFAVAYVRQRAARRYGRLRIIRELRRKGVTDELVEASLAEALPNRANELALIRKRLDRRLQGKKPPYSQKLLRSIYASLLRAGFPSAIIRDELFHRAKQDLLEDVELDAGDEGP